MSLGGALFLLIFLFRLIFLLRNLSLVPVHFALVIGRSLIRTSRVTSRASRALEASAPAAIE
jgi:hypothetical protein